MDVVQGLFPDRQNDFVLSVGDSDVALIHQLPESGGEKEIQRVAALLEDSLRVGGDGRVVVGIGTVALHLRDLAKSYKEAQIAIEVGKVFDTSPAGTPGYSGGRTASGRSRTRSGCSQRTCGW